MIEQMVELMKELEKNDELFKITARMMRKLYDSLIEVGFTEAQAVQIVASQGTGFKTS
jgi:hypothetical protein